MNLCGRGRPVAILAVLTALTLGGCATPTSPADPPGDPASSGTQQRLERGVSGRVTHAGSPVPGAMVQPAPGPGNAAAEREVFAVSDAGGRYRIGLSPGVWDLTVYADGYAALLLRVTVPAAGIVVADAPLEPVR